jgi:hypothetical protein
MFLSKVNVFIFNVHSNILHYLKKKIHRGRSQYDQSHVFSAHYTLSSPATFHCLQPTE